MPTYEYGCQGCGHEWELEQRISEDPIKKCPKCKKQKARRLISAGNFILKGSGWYADLYHKPAAAKSEPGASEASSSSDSSDAKPSSESKSESASSDAKPAAKSEPKADAKTPAKTKKKAANE